MTGSGTPEDPYVIYDVDDLQAMENDLSAYYELANDIDASATVGWNAGAGFAPVDDFEGSLDGKGYKVTDLFIDRSGSNVGLFDLIKSGAEVKNLGLEGCNITGRNGGALATRNDGAITSCYSTGSVTSSINGGGLVALNYGTMEECYSTCTIISGDYAGGLVSYNPGTITKSYATGSVTATVWDAGGLVMRNAGTITNCYARGAVVANYDAGGLVEDNTGSIDKCYSTGLVTGGSDIGGLVEMIFAPGTVTNSFWDTETSGTAISDGGTGKTTAQMKTESTFTDAGWDFDTIWTICAGVNGDYPCLVGVTPSCIYAPVIPFIINKAYALAREEL